MTSEASRVTVPLFWAVFQAAVEATVPPVRGMPVTSSASSTALSSPLEVTALSTYSPLKETGKLPDRSSPLSLLTFRPLIVTLVISEPPGFFALQTSLPSVKFRLSWG